MESVKIAIVVKGGLVQSIYSSLIRNIDVDIIDLDNEPERESEIPDAGPMNGMRKIY